MRTILSDNNSTRPEKEAEDGEDLSSSAGEQEAEGLEDSEAADLAAEGLEEDGKLLKDYIFFTILKWKRI